MWWTGGINPSFLTSALDGGEQSASFSYRFTPEERALSISFMGGSRNKYDNVKYKH
jgi:hypothetical protein